MLSKGNRSQHISVNNLTRNTSIFTLFKLSKNFGQHVSAYICIFYINFYILLWSSLFRIILIPDDIFRFYKNFRLPVLQGNFGFFFVVFFPIVSIGILPSKTERTSFLGVFPYIWKIITSNKTDLAVYSSDLLLLSSEYFGENLFFDWK